MNPMRVSGYSLTPEQPHLLVAAPEVTIIELTDDEIFDRYMATHSNLTEADKYDLPEIIEVTRRPQADDVDTLQMVRNLRRRPFSSVPDAVLAQYKQDQQVAYALRDRHLDRKARRARQFVANRKYGLVKIIHDTGRGGSDHLTYSYAQPRSSYVEAPTAPQTQRMRPSRYTKEDNALRLNPLERYLRSHLGRPWDEVYSAICQAADSRCHNGDDLRYWVRNRVDIHTHLGVNGEILTHHCQPIDWGFYVDPISGLLCEALKACSKRSQPTHHAGLRILKRDSQNGAILCLEVRPGLHLILHKGVWSMEKHRTALYLRVTGFKWHIWHDENGEECREKSTFTDVHHVRDRKSFRGWSEQEVEIIDQNHSYLEMPRLVSERSLNRRELRRYGLRNTYPN